MKIRKKPILLSIILVVSFTVLCVSCSRGNSLPIAASSKTVASGNIPAETIGEAASTVLAGVSAPVSTSGVSISATTSSGGVSVLTNSRGREVSGTQDSSGVHYSFTDALGRKVVLNGQPERVVSLLGSYAETWLLAGGDLAGVTDDVVSERYMDVPEGTSIIGTVKNPNMEKVLLLDPDFVLLSPDVQGHVLAARILEQAKVPYGYFKVEQFEDYLKMLDICTDITGRKDLYEQYGLAVQQRIDEILAAVGSAMTTPGSDEKLAGTFAGDNSTARAGGTSWVGNAGGTGNAGGVNDTSKIGGTGGTSNARGTNAQAYGRKPTVLFVRALSGKAKAKADDNMACRMLEDLGTDNIAKRHASLLDELTMEAVIAEDPDFIFVVPMGDTGKALQSMHDIFEVNPAWAGLTAVKEGRYVVLPKELFHYKPNARWAESYEYLAGIIYG